MGFVRYCSRWKGYSFEDVINNPDLEAGDYSIGIKVINPVEMAIF